MERVLPLAQRQCHDCRLPLPQVGWILTIALGVLADTLQQVLVSGEVGVTEVELNLQRGAGTS